MRRILYVLLIIAPTLAYSQHKLVVNGSAPMLNDGTEILLQQLVPNRLSSLNYINTTKVNGHHFKFILNTDGAEEYYLGLNRHGYRLFLEPGKADINIADSTLSKVSVTGNPTNIEWDIYNRQNGTNTLNDKYNDAEEDYYHYQAIKNYDTTLAAIKWKRMDSLRLLVQKQELASCLVWIKQHPNSLLNTSILYNELLYIVPYISESELKAVYYSMPASITGNIWGKELRYHIDNLFIGATAPDFSQSDTSGRQQKLTNFRGKYVLIDFWASWCLYCREEAPVLIKTMKRFENKDFTIVSISVDDKRDNWIKAIKQDGLYWTQLSSLDGRENPAAIAYYANTFPFNYLIDPTGKIIAKNLRGDQLIAKLDSLLK